MNPYFSEGYIVQNCQTLKEKLMRINSLLANLLGVESNQPNFLDAVHSELKNKFEDSEKYFGFLKAFTNSPIVQSISSDPELLSLVKKCGIKNPSLVTPPILHVVAKDLMVNTDKVFTPPHQDVISTKGSIGQVVVWIPLHDIPINSYGITAIPGSHKLGILETDFSEFGHCVKASLMEGMSSKYIEMNFGDVVIFSQYLIHSTHTLGKFRMALSFRFNDLDDSDWSNRKFYVPFERVGIKTKFADGRDLPPKESEQYFSNLHEKN